ncbi:MAG TPA: CapA family protein [Jiangellaceae bacterium]
MPRPIVPAAAAAMVLLASCSMIHDEEPAQLGKIALRSELETPTPDIPPTREFTIVATGDILLHPPLWDQARDDADAGADAMDFTPQLASIAPIVSAADLSICHLETPLAPAGGAYAGYPRFAAPPQIVPALADTGYTACTLASNHTFDQGADGVDRTLDALRSQGIATVGAARTEADDEPTLIEVSTDAGPVAVGLVAYTFSFNGIPFPDGDTWRSNLIGEECVFGAACADAAATILADAATAREVGAEVVIVSLHWGDEYVHDPNAFQLELAAALLDSPDVDLILGHHAHWVQPMENIDGEWVVYGMGNLMAGHATQNQPLREGLLVRFTLAEALDTGEFTTSVAEYLPVYQTYDDPRRVVDVPAELDSGDPAESADRLQTAFDRTTEVVGSRGAFDDGLTLLTE